MSADSPFAKLGSIEQKLYQETSTKETVAKGEITEQSATHQAREKHVSPTEKRSLKKPATEKPQASHDATIPRYHDTTIPFNHDTTIPQDEHDVFEAVRKSVKQIGKEAATHRFTLEEKNQLADIEYTYKRQNIRTSENEITRIAINYFIEDYRKNGEHSLLAKILHLINS